MFMQEHFMRIKKVYNTHNVTTDQITRTAPGESLTIQCLSGTIWVNPNGTAATDNESVQLSAGMALDITVDKELKYVSDGTGATAQVISWKM